MNRQYCFFKTAPGQRGSIRRLLFLGSLITTLLCGACTTTPTEKNPENILWYSQPAQNWNEALPLGNGSLGVMVFGRTSDERIQLNDDSMWPGENGWDNPDGNAEDVERIRELLFRGENAAADRLFVEKFSRKKVVRSHQTLGDLLIGFNHDSISDYRRELDMGRAVASVSYRSGGDLVKETVFVSNPHRAIVIEIETEAQEGLNGKVRLSRPSDKGHPTVHVKTDDQNLLIMQGTVTQRNGVFDSKPSPILTGTEFETCLKIDHTGGTVSRGEDYLELVNVKRALFYLVSNTSFYHEEFREENLKVLASLADMDVEKLKEEHIRDHQKLYSRVNIKLGDTEMDTIPTDERLQRVKQGSTDPGLEALLFQYGRYLLIGSSRQGTNPANLQGLWNQRIKAPWNGDYHLNINLQMNYWPANLTNLDELNMPLFDYVDRLVENGKITARKNFGCRGTFIPHATDLLAPTWMRAPTAFWGCSMGGGGWIIQHYWRHFEFTADTTFLEHRAFPAIREVARFYSDWLIEDPRDGTLVSAPSTSPENRFINAGGEAVASCLGSAMDQQIIAEVFDHYIKASEALQKSSGFLDTIRQQRALLRPGFVLGTDGRILEWDREYREHEPGHRHMSHLYGFHPGSSVSKDKTPETFEAVRRTLDYRLDHGGAGTGWSRAWLINCSARLLDGAMAGEHVQLLLKKSIGKNLFDLHPPFQIDGNFGFTAGVAEMLLQSHEANTVRILPALPPHWESGYIEGLRARGGLTVDIHWSKNQLDRVVIRSGADHEFDLRYGESVIPVVIEKNKVFTYEPAPGVKAF
ncbi:MAG: glycoside hydrolase family 95 protein [Bacteroidota bacterium]